ncbi:MAG: hypothetical protein V1750_05745, partial [Acidobacteriota bacterium]
MTCDELRRALDEDEPLLAPAARAHLASCAACARAAAHAQAVRRELRAMADEEPPQELHGLVM